MVTAITPITPATPSYTLNNTQGTINLEIAGDVKNLTINQINLLSGSGAQAYGNTQKIMETWLDQLLVDLVDPENQPVNVVV